MSLETLNYRMLNGLGGYIAEKSQKKNNVRNHKIFEKSKSLTMDLFAISSGGVLYLAIYVKKNTE